MSGNLCRIIPEGLSAEISLSSVKPLPIFSFIQQVGDIDEKEMLSTFNCGVGYIIVTGRESVRPVIEQVSKFYDCYEIGQIVRGSSKVQFHNHISWL